MTGLSSVRWLAVDLWISEQEINGLNPPLWAKYYSSSSFRKKHLYLQESWENIFLKSLSEHDKRWNVENDVFYGFTDQSESEQSRAKNVLMEENIKPEIYCLDVSNKLYNCLQLDACNPNYTFIS